MIRNKKAEENWAPDTLLFWLLFVVFVGFAAIMLSIFMLKAGIGQTFIYGNAEEYTIYQRFFGSQSCFAYGENGIKRSNMIDIEKFKKEVLDFCYKPENDQPYFKFVLAVANSPPNSIASTGWIENFPGTRLSQQDILVYSKGELKNAKISVEFQKQK